MRVLLDLTEPLSEWMEFLQDMQCELDDVDSSVRYYDPVNSSVFLDELIESDYNDYTDDVIEYIQKTAKTLLRGRLDDYMTNIGLEINRIIHVFMSNLNGIIFALMDVTISPIPSLEEYGQYVNDGGYIRSGEGMADVLGFNTAV